MATRKRASTPSESVGIADLRTNLSKYLKMAAAGRPVIVRDRGRAAYVLTRYQEQEDEVFGCMKDRTHYTEGVVMNADESWTPNADVWPKPNMTLPSPPCFDSCSTSSLLEHAQQVTKTLPSTPSR